MKLFLSYQPFIGLALTLMCVLATACSDSIAEPDEYLTRAVQVQVQGELPNKEGITVRMTDDKGTIFTQVTDDKGIATFKVPVGIYDVVVSHVSQPEDGWRTVYNGSASNVAVMREGDCNVSLTLTTATASAIIIRELYVGGCQRDDGSGWFYRDKYVIIANNSDQRVELPGLCLAIATPYNSYSLNKNYDESGHLNYENEGFVPAASSFWYFQDEVVTFEPW